MTRGTRLSIPELPDDWAEYCIQRRPDLKPLEVWEDFYEHWTNKPGKDGVMLDWKLTWQTWVRRQWKKPVFAPEAPKRIYPQSKPIQAGRPDSAAYREFRERMGKLKTSEPIGTFVSLGQALQGRSQTERHPTLNRTTAGSTPASLAKDAEWQEERLAMQQQDRPL